MRGKQITCLVVSLIFRITPACAGKTRHRSRHTVPGMGSPPRVRGKPEKFLFPHLYQGITPACAGKTWCKNFPLLRVWDHPRVCGENTGYKNGIECVMGSPPRVRGKQLLRCLSFHALRITPACAGKTHPIRVPNLSPEDHPRVCGEN